MQGIGVTVFPKEVMVLTKLKWHLGWKSIVAFTGSEGHWQTFTMDTRRSTSEHAQNIDIHTPPTILPKVPLQRSDTRLALTDTQ